MHSPLRTRKRCTPYQLRHPLSPNAGARCITERRLVVGPFSRLNEDEIITRMYLLTRIRYRLSRRNMERISENVSLNPACLLSSVADEMKRNRIYYNWLELLILEGGLFAFPVSLPSHLVTFGHSLK